MLGWDCPVQWRLFVFAMCVKLEHQNGCFSRDLVGSYVALPLQCPYAVAHKLGGSPSQVGVLGYVIVQKRSSMSKDVLCIVMGL